MRSRAVVFTGPGVVEVGDVECPEPGAEDVVIALRHSWISTGSESSFLRGERIAGDTPRGEGDPLPFPMVAGYQKVGTVVSVGERVLGLEPGDTVFATRGRVEGMTELFPYGGHVSPAVVPRAAVWRLPDHVDPLAFSGLVLTQVGYNCGARPPVAVGDPAVVLGDGLVGHWAAQTLAWRGAEVVLVGRHPDRLARFEPGPPHATIDSRVVEPHEWLAKRFPDGLAVVVDTVGSIAAVEAMVPAMRRFGHIVSAGFYGNDDRLALQPLREREITVDVVSGIDKGRMDIALQLIAAGHLQTLPLITHHFPVDHAAQAWQLIVDRAEPFLGVVLDWQ
ncbi:zinc-binding dehydrogenase [Pseudonocardia sp. GCM10023141]|uniref:zinc-binding dehydrogenase n=1 Tax=Pseudonocardia sp. GCM10023141 TaxID=3252653 RepID=UPI00361ECC04